MKTQKNILIAFVLNLAFSAFEFFGGVVTGSVAILSDAVHDLGDAASIGISFFLEKKSKKGPDETYTFGYGRFSVLGGFLTTVILAVGSAGMIVNAIGRLKNPTAIDYDGMLLFAVVGVVVNLLAAFTTRGGGSVNQRAVNLHMLEDVFGWAVVLAGAVVMRFTDLVWLDPLLSIGVSVYILFHALQNLKEILEMFLQKVPDGLSVAEIREHITQMEGVLDIHHIHLWTMDGQNRCATMHIVTAEEPQRVKAAIRQELAHHGVSHVTVETESPTEHCRDRVCIPQTDSHHGHHHSHHH